MDEEAQKHVYAGLGSPSTEISQSIPLHSLSSADRPIKKKSHSVQQLMVWKEKL